MQSGKTVTTGLVLRVTDTKETDRILTVLSSELGKIPVVARGARRKGSRVAAACQPMAYSELTIYRRGNWYMLDEAASIELFDGMGRDIGLLSLGAWFCELAEAVCAEETPVPEVLALLLNALYALCHKGKEPLLVKTAFAWRLMALAGFQPLVDGCAVCGKTTPEVPVLDVYHGFLACKDCKSEENGLRMALTDSGVDALRYILSCPAKRLYAFSLENEALRRLDGAAEAFIAAQLERKFRTLDYYKSVTQLP